MKIRKRKKHFTPLQPEFWQKKWLEANNKSSLRLTMSNIKKWTDFWNCISKAYHYRNEQERGLVTKVIDLISQEGLINKESRVLDIGCGPGTYALPLAPIVSHITAIDIAEEMLSVLTEQAKECDIRNIFPLYARWEECDFDSEFDFVLASYSPAIRTAESVLKMNKASRKYASIITPGGVDTFQTKIRNDLWRIILDRKCESYAFHIIFPFNFLYTIGIRPSVKLIKHKISYEEPLEHLFTQYESYFKIFTKLTQTKVDRMQRYLRKISHNGVVKVQSERMVYVMWWETSDSNFG